MRRFANYALSVTILLSLTLSSTGCFLCRSKKPEVVVLRQPCELPDDPKLAAVEFIYCGNPACDALEQRRKMAREDPAVDMPTAAMVKAANCYNCLDVPNAANLAHTLGVEKAWREDAKERCSPLPKPSTP